MRRHPWNTNPITCEIVDWGYDRRADEFWATAFITNDQREHELSLEIPVRFRRAGEVLELAEVEVSGVVPTGGITTDVWRAIPLGEIYEQVQARIRDERQSEWGPDAASPPMPSRGWVRTYRHVRQPGRPGRSDREWAQFAIDYSRHKDSKTPTQDFAAERQLDYSQMRNRIYRARRKGFLAPTRQGRHCLEPTEKAWKAVQDGPH
jgi:hypothetical protein